MTLDVGDLHSNPKFVMWIVMNYAQIFADTENDAVPNDTITAPSNPTHSAEASC